MTVAFQAGDPLHKLSAKWLNRVDALVRSSDAARDGLTIPDLPNRWSENVIVRVRNDSGGPRRQWDVLGIDGPLITAAANLSEFQRVTLKGQTPNQSHRGRFVVLLEPLAANAIGDAVAVGFAPVRINHPEAEAPRVADIVIGECGHLVESTTGVPVMYAEPPDLDGMRWAVVNLSPGVAAPPAEINPCCGCPPTRCYDFNGLRPPTFTIDFGDLLCCDGLAGGVKRLYWSGFAWASPMFWCNPDGGTNTECGTAIYRWREEADPCAGTSAMYRWNPGYEFVPGLCLGGNWTLQTPCPDGCSSAPPPDRNPAIETTCETVFQDSPCSGSGPTEPGWELVSSSCSCGEPPTPPERDGAYDGEEVTVICPGTPPDPPTVPCEGDQMATVLWSGDDLQEAKDLGLYAVPGTITWFYSTVHCVAPQYMLMINGCDPLEVAQSARPTISPGDLTWSNAPPVTSLPAYVITACPDEPCPPPGKVPARWVLVPPSGYSAAVVELRVNNTVRLRYVLPPGRVFCERCLNRFTIEQDDCDWPCDNIPEDICARPGDGYVKSDCLPLASSYAMSIPEMTVSNPQYGHIAAGEMGLAAGDYILDLMNNAGMDPRYEENGCRTITPRCCTWRAPYSGVGTAAEPCTTWSQVGWVLQTCDPQTRTGNTARRFQNYDCGDDSEPVLRFGLYLWQTGWPGLTGPSVIQWTQFFGTDYTNELYIGDDKVTCGGNSSCCWSPGDGCGPGGTSVFDPSTVSESSFYLQWNLHETLEDGTLVMKMLDAAYTGWVTAFPQTIELAPQ